ncbi:GNAT family N-acetyltransferase [Psychrobacter aquaticus]|uniref:N-acetyltransferase domain-containing protein n=1 Tax=Psychrobacter aquaticus CMS 56 TaxID=1354303 RepID=U4T467_9GAMM|nr:GNAT family N-acetyltransferase [Psychrobacter aquaticus]ERL56122.1 hypothetical protein M917_0800 [Psychrobacter aquaticus CMS 56]
MNINIHHQCTDHDSYRSARIKSLFNVEQGANVHINADLPIEDDDWQIGVIVGGSGTGKTSIGKKLWPRTPIHNPKWDKTKPIIDQIAAEGSIDDATACLSAVGLGTVPAWLRPHHVLSNGEQFRANLARALADEPNRLVIDEFSSVVDRQIACIGANAFAKAWRRTKGKQAVLLTCHYDVLDWLQPDWVYDTSKSEFTRGSLWQRPPITFDIYQTNWQFWHLFEPHHYLKMPLMIAATNYVAVVNGKLVAHIAVSTRPGLIEARSCRLVVMPEWQGAGIGMRFLNQVSEHWLNAENRYDKPLRTIFHTSHPNLAAALRRSTKWTQISGQLHGGRASRSTTAAGGKYGGHFRAVQGFRYLGASCD